MAFNLPFLSKKKQEEPIGQEDVIAQQSPAETAGSGSEPLTVMAVPERDFAEEKGDKQASMMDPNATIIDGVCTEEPA